MHIKQNIIYGFGVCDSKQIKIILPGGKPSYCPFYIKWARMIERCYSKSLHKRYPTYAGCHTSSDWLTFSNFKEWMKCQDWQGKNLDKDILLVGNKFYSPETCVFVDPMTNSFILDNAASRGKFPIGVSWHKRDMKFQANCKNPFTKKLEFLGYFQNPEEAHETWRKRKHELACQLAELQTDGRVAKALRTRYL